MNVCEIFTSIQGESTYTGLPCTFIRLAGCNLRCTYCDTSYSYEDGVALTGEEIIGRVIRAGINLVEVTGGEPLLQKETPSLIRKLLDRGYQVLLETNGSLPVRELDSRAIVILDVKPPGSGMSDKNDYSNLNFLKPADEVKFVLCSRADYEWAKEKVEQNALTRKCTVLFSAVTGMLDPADLAKWIVADRVPVRLNLQIHKYIFGPDVRQV